MGDKTAMMLDTERKRGEELETLIPRLYHHLRTHEAVANELGVCHMTLLRWLKRLGASRGSRRIEVTIPGKR